MRTDIQSWDAVVDHRTGTPGDHETASWLAEAIAAAGAEPQLETFPFQRRVLHECRITIGGQSADGVPLFDGGYTDEAGVSAKLKPLDEVGRKEGSYIGVGAFTSTGRHQSNQQMQAARQENYPAIVAYSAAADVVPGLALLNAPRYDNPFGPPVLQVSTEHCPWLEAAAADNAEAHVIAHISFEQTNASNVQTTVPGRDPFLAPLVIMTPRSAWWTCTAERGGGIAIWLACIRHFTQQPGERDVIFTANTGHELGHLGLDHYLANRPDLLRAAHAWIHLGANFASLESDVLFQASPDLMQLGLEQLAAADRPPDSITPLHARPLGEAENIYDGGGRYLSLLGSNRWFHHPDDRWPYTVDLERTTKLGQAMLKIAQALASR